LTLMDNFTRESLAVEVDVSLGGWQVVEVLMRVAMEVDFPKDTSGQWPGVHFEDI
jgi:hypothetical protein